MADRAVPDLVASFFTLSGAGFVDPPRNVFVQRCEAAAAAGFSGIGLHTADLARTVAAGLDVDGMRAVLRDTGLRVVEIEFLAGWAFGDAGLDDAVRAVDEVAIAFGGRHVSGGEFSGPRAGFVMDDAAARLAAVAARLARRQLLLAVEAFPWSAVGDLDTAIELVRQSEAPTAGLLIDVWHFYNTGSAVGQLVDLPGAGIAAVQLNDGQRVHDDFLAHARSGRRLVGDGELDVVGLIRAVDAAGFAGPYCVEVNTPGFRALPPREAAVRAFETSSAALSAALG